MSDERALHGGSSLSVAARWYNREVVQVQQAERILDALQDEADALVDALDASLTRRERDTLIRRLAQIEKKIDAKLDDILRP